jgi:subtilisin family serine protease
LVVYIRSVMLPTFKKVVSGVVGLALGVSVLGGGLLPQPAIAQTSINLPWYVQLVENTSGQEWTQKPGSQLTAKVNAVVHINKAPLAMVGRFWSHAQRVAYVAEIRAEQDKLIPQIQALGGTIVGRFTHASAGLGVSIDASKMDELRSLGGVLAARGITDYQLDLSETVGFIGGLAAQNLGYDGSGVDVAVIDSGVDYSHIKLGGPGTVAGYNDAYCGDPAIAADPFDPACTAYDFPDTTGFFGDPQYGRDGSPINKVVGGWDWFGEGVSDGAAGGGDPNPIDFEGHGTHVADIIAGLESSPGAGDAGVAPGANIWAFKACTALGSACGGLALLFAVDDALDLDDSDYGACTPGVDPYCLAYDPADVINMSLGSPYGQPEDDLTLFTDIAAFYGSLPVVSAGNSGDRPYIVGSPSTANGALSVAQSTVPSDKFYKITAGSATVNGVLQPWSPAPVGTLNGVLQYGNGAGGNLNGCAAFAPGSLTGKVLLVDRGTCNNSIKGSNGSAAGATFVVIANNAFSNTPPVFSFGGGTITVPTLTITQNDGAILKGQLGQVASTGDTSIIPLVDDIVASSGRGPRIADGDIKPDIAAPGASVSAEVGTGSGKTAFGGTSGAAPMVAGAAALLIDKLEEDGLLDSDPGLDGFGEFGLSYSFLVKSILMNTAQTNTFIGGSFLAPITLQGAGRVDALKAVKTETIATDQTDFQEWFATGEDFLCSTYPGFDIFFFVEFGIPPDCADDYPFGNDFFNAWNSTTGSLSFGYDGVSATTVETRKLVIENFGSTSRTYNLSNSFRYSDDVSKGVTISISPSSVTIPAGGSASIDVTLTTNASKLRNWTLDAGQFGATGTNILCNNANPTFECSSLTLFEIDGYIKVNGGANNTVNVPWQILPKRAAETYVSEQGSNFVRLRNPALYKAGDTDIFSLVEISPNNCEITDGSGNCAEENYVPGILPGINATAIDLKEVGVRSYTVPGLNAALGLPAAPSGAINDEVLDFALTVYDAPFRASHNYPVEFDIYIDSNSDGVNDYVVFNADQTLNAADGRNAVFVADVNPANGTRPLRPYFYSFTDFNSQNWILPVPASAVDVRSNRPFKFYVLSFDAYFTGDLWDCSPFNCGEYHQYQTGLPKYRPVTTSVQVKKNGSSKITFSKPSGGATASPSQDGLLFLYRDAKVGRESDAVTLP